MTATQLLIEGGRLMVIGMGFVIVFLLLLIMMIQLMSCLINRYLEHKHMSLDIMSPQGAHDSTDHSSEAYERELATHVERLRPVIAAAIHYHRQHHRG